ncbi:hypothetical protein [Floridanema evergladense]|uniref:Uncharacterized protein n=1 Tax=Floridaenema evergladense BLCC-F167 TaxID=3153639 RepID=A0ABV4WP31_9CYAN
MSPIGDKNFPDLDIPNENQYIQVNFTYADLLYILRSNHSRRGRGAFGEVDVGAGLVDNLFSRQTIFGQNPP